MKKLLHIGLIGSAFFGSLFSTEYAEAGCSVTYSFTSGNNAVASQVNRDFSDIDNCFTNATLSTLTVNSNGTLGSVYQGNITNGTGTLALGVNVTAAEVQSQGGVPLYINYGGNNVILDATGGNVGIGTTTPAQALEVNGEVKVDTFASASATAVCQNGNVLSSCSSSIRYKEHVQDATFGLTDILQLRPVTFKWKGRDENDIGLIAEEVEKVNPRFVTYKDGHIEGVKYPQMTAVLINAVKTLKDTSDRQAAEIAELQNQLGRLQRNSSVHAASAGP